MISTVYIAKNVYGGDGLGRLGDGRVVFVPGAFAGEQVKAQITEERRSFVKARLVEVVEPSADRTGFAPEPVPGMVYANLSIKGEEKAKEEQLREALERARLIPQGAKDIIAPIVSSPRELGYRNKVVYHIAREEPARQHSRHPARRDSPRFVLGYLREPEHTVQDVTADPLARAEINAALPAIRSNAFALLTQGAPAVRKSIEAKGSLTIRWSKSSGVKWWIGPAPQDVVIKEMTLSHIFEVPADGFWQVNPEVGEALVRAVIREYEKGKTTSPDILDLYCGVGVLGLSCRPARLTGIESGRRAVDFASRNAAAFPGVQSRFFAQEVGRNLRRLRIHDSTTIILDPPRGGLERGVAQFLAHSPAKRLLYASCDPATLVRDLRELARAFEIERAESFNMFPRTARFETLVTLSRRR